MSLCCSTTLDWLGFKKNHHCLVFARVEFCLCTTDIAELTHLHMAAGSFVMVAGGQRKWASGNSISGRNDDL